MTSRAFWAALSCALFAAVVGGAVHLSGSTAGNAGLWALCAIQIAPVTVLALLFGKLLDVRDIDGLTRTERRRLEDMVGVRARSIGWTIFLLAAGGVAMALGLYVATYMPEAVVWCYTAAGGLIGLSISLSTMAYFDVQHIASFRTKITDREREAKAKAAVLAKMSPKKDHAA